MRIEIRVEVRYARATTVLSVDLKDVLKKWENVRRIEDYVADKTIRYEIEIEPPMDITGLLNDLELGTEQFLNRIVVKGADGVITSRDYAAERRESAEALARRSGVTHYRRRGDPYIETD